MKRVIVGFEEWSSRKMKDCRIRACRNLLRHYSIKLDSNVLFIVGRGIGLKYKPFKLKPDSNFVIWSLIGANEFFQEDLFKNLNVIQNSMHINNDEEGMRALLRYIDRGIPVVTAFNSMYLASNKEDANKYKIGSYSVATLVGYNTDEDALYLDFYRELIGELSGLYKVDIKNFARSRNVQCVPSPPENKCYTVQVEDNHMKWIYSNTRELLISGLKDIAERMLNTETGDTEFEGFGGMMNFINTLEEFCSYISESGLPENQIERIINIKFSYLKSSLMIGSDTFYRSEFGKAIKRIRCWVDCPELNQIGEGFIEVGKEWRNVCELLSQSITDLKVLDLHFYDIINSLRSIAEHEKDLFKDLQMVLN